LRATPTMPIMHDSGANRGRPNGRFAQDYS
jgi:hypothetical protein